MKTLGTLVTTVALLLAPAQAVAQEHPILVVDKCPEFCPKPEVKKPKMCTMALVPVPKKKHWFWTDGCKTKMIYMPPIKKGNR